MELLVKPCRAVNTLRHGYKNQSDNVLQGKICCLFRDPHKSHKFHVITMWNFLRLNLVVRIITGRL